MFIINFFFKILTRVECNYLCSHLHIRLDKANRILTLFSYFFYICASGSSAPLGTFPSSSIGFNLMTNLTYFPGTRSMEFHQFSWFLKYQTSGIPSIWLIFQAPDRWNFINLVPNALHLSTISINWAELHSWPLGHLSNRFQDKKTEKITSKNYFSVLQNCCFSENHRCKHLFLFFSYLRPFQLNAPWHFAQLIHRVKLILRKV